MTEPRRPHVVHQTGAAGEASVREAYRKAGIEAEVLPFIDDMAARLIDCDLIVCRAGAITVSELCAAGVAAVLVPFVASTTSHQRDNAAWLASHEGAIHLDAVRAVAGRSWPTLLGEPDARGPAVDGDPGPRPGPAACGGARRRRDRAHGGERAA